MKETSDLESQGQEAVQSAGFLAEGLPYGASRMKDRGAARMGMGFGVGLMAFGATIFAVGWWIKLAWLVESAFVVTLVAWMLLVISFAFWVIAIFAARFPRKAGVKTEGGA